MYHTPACLAGMHVCSCTVKYKEDKLDAQERFWIGPRLPQEYLVYKMQSRDTEQKWLVAEDGTRLEPDYSEFSVRIHDPKAKSLSFVNRTLAIIPKSRLRIIHKLIGEYLNDHDDT